MSDDGGLDEFREVLRAFANSPSSSRIRCCCFADFSPSSS